MKKMEFETFHEIRDYEIRDLINKNPYCFNGDVSIRKYKITIEEIDEPKEVLITRIQKLWDECDNHHNTLSIRSIAKKLGYELIGNYGNKRH